MKSNGFSLIELILYVALLGIIVSGMVIFGLNVLLIRSKNRVEQEVIANARLVGKRINYEVRNAIGVNSVGSHSISLINSDSTRNPVVITFESGRIKIGVGSAGSCPVTAPCFLTSNKVTVQSLLFADMGGTTGRESIKYETVIKSAAAGAGKSYYYQEYATGSAEIRSK